MLLGETCCYCVSIVHGIVTLLLLLMSGLDVNLLGGFHALFDCLCGVLPRFNCVVVSRYMLGWCFCDGCYRWCGYRRVARIYICRIVIVVWWCYLAVVLFCAFGGLGCICWTTC